MYKPLLLASCFFLGLSITFPVFSQDGTFNTNRKVKDSELLRVGILDFVDLEASGDYTFLESSISADIQRNLRKRFLYTNTSAKENQNVISDILILQNVEKRALSPEYIETLADKNNLDIVIYGFYNIFQKNKKSRVKVDIESRLYLSFLDRVLSLESIRRDFNSNFFNLTYKVASLFTDKIDYLIGLRRKFGTNIIIPYKKKGKYDFSEALSKEIKQFREYFRIRFKEEVLELSEYLENNPELGGLPPAKVKALLRWGKENKISNLIRMSLKKKKGKVSVLVYSIKKGYLRRADYSLSLSPQVPNKSLEKSALEVRHFIVTGELGKPFPITRDDFRLGWNDIFLNVGLSLNMGLILLENDIGYNPNASLRFVFSPGLFAKNSESTFFKAFDSPWMRHFSIGILFGFSNLWYSTSLADETRNRTLTRSLSAQFYAGLLELSYFFVYRKYIRFLTGVSGGYYYSTRRNTVQETNIGLDTSGSAIYNPVFSIRHEISYMFSSFFSVGGQASYTYFQNPSVASSGSNAPSPFHNLNLGLLINYLY